MHGRVVITGIGAVTPAGATSPATFEGLAAGTSFTRWVTPAELDWPVRFGSGGGLGDGDRFPAAVTQGLEPADWNRRLEQLARTALGEAIREAGWSARECATAGLVLGASKGDLSAVDDPYRLSPGGPAMAMGREWGFGAGWLAPVAACATGLISIGQAWERLVRGEWVRAVAGGVDSSFHPGLIASYRRLGVLSREKVNAAGACRPFDVARSGFVVGEGAGAVVLEAREQALGRGAVPLAEIRGFALRSEAAGPLQLPVRPDSLAAAITEAISMSGLMASDIDVVSLHGTGTQVNDRLEAAALRLALGDRVDVIPAWSCKGAIGHLLGASGAVELAMLVLALRNGRVPPTMNLRNPSPDCKLCHVMDSAGAGTFRVGLKLSLGFGGHCAAMVVALPEEL